MILDSPVYDYYYYYYYYCCCSCYARTNGPLVVKTNSEVIINCSISEGSYSYWEILYIRKASVSRRVGTIAPGISVTTYGINMSSLVMNTSDTTIIGLVCYGSTFMAEVKARINLTIYGMLINYYRP